MVAGGVWVSLMPGAGSLPFRIQSDLSYTIVDAGQGWKNLEYCLLIS